MADATLPTTGKDWTVELMLNGTPQKVIDSVLEFSEEAKYANIETRHLGSNDVDHDREPEGWGGRIKFSRRNKQLDDFIDAYNLFLRNRVPVLIFITRTHKFRDGSSDTKVYQDVKLDFSGEVTRGSVSTTTMNWVSGKERI